LREIGSRRADRFPSGVLSGERRNKRERIAPHWP
jgi:hypothetical protein